MGESKEFAERPGGEEAAGCGRMNRRELLGAGAVAAATLALPGGAEAVLNRGAMVRAARRPLAREGAFAWGVASGFPTPRAIVLWTRVGGLDRTSRIRYEVAKDPGFNRLVDRGTALAREAEDYTLHAPIDGLEPGREYHYRFFTDEKSSPVGRFRTAPPPDSKQPVKIGFFSCQNWQAGYFNAHAALADERDLDLVVCLGDYIYEDRTYPGPRSDDTGDNSDGDAQHLREYRQKYRLYQSDRNLQAMQASHPFVGLWDDHEVENNYAGSKPSSAASEGMTTYGEPRRVTMERRQRNGYEAFFEAMPRLRHAADPMRTYGRAKIGALCDLFLLDERQYRDQQPCGDAFFTPCPDSNDPGRKFLGESQKRWLKRRLSRSDASWKLLGNQLMVMAFDVAPGQPVLLDSWEGYGAERSEVMSHIVDNGIENVVALTGDIHTFFTGYMTTTGRVDGTRAGVEFVGGAISSLGVKETLGNAPGIENLENAISADNPHITYADFDKRGYGVVELTKNEAICRYMAPETALEEGSPVSEIARFRVPAGSVEIERL